MARPRRRTRHSVSLFPFLSILACVIGTLILVITASATSQVASGSVDLERFARLETEIASDRERLARLTALEQELEELAGELDAVREREEALAEQRDALARGRVLDGPRREVLRREEARVATLEQQLAPLRAENTRARDALAERERAASAAPIRIRPAGSGLGLDPRFVECRPEGIVLHDPDGGARPIPAHLVAASPEFSRFLRDALFDRDASVIFLIREGGVGTCARARPVARRHRVRSGEMPLVGDGPLDFGALRGRS